MASGTYASCSPKDESVPRVDLCGMRDFQPAPFNGSVASAALRVPKSQNPHSALFRVGLVDDQIRTDKKKIGTPPLVVELATVVPALSRRGWLLCLDVAALSLQLRCP
jgi:hypothetical protein